MTKSTRQQSLMRRTKHQVSDETEVCGEGCSGAAKRHDEIKKALNLRKIFRRDLDGKFLLPRALRKTALKVVLDSRGNEMTELERELLMLLANAGARAIYDAGYYADARRIYELINQIESANGENDVKVHDDS